MKSTKPPKTEDQPQNPKPQYPKTPSPKPKPKTQKLMKNTWGQNEKKDEPVFSIQGLFFLCAREDKSEAIQEHTTTTPYTLTCMYSLGQHQSRVKLNQLNIKVGLMFT